MFLWGCVSMWVFGWVGSRVEWFLLGPVGPRNPGVPWEGGDVKSSQVATGETQAPPASDTWPSLSPPHIPTGQATHPGAQDRRGEAEVESLSAPTAPPMPLPTLSSGLSPQEGLEPQENPRTWRWPALAPPAPRPRPFLPRVRPCLLKGTSSWCLPTTPGLGVGGSGRPWASEQTQ